MTDTRPIGRISVAFLRQFVEKCYVINYNVIIRNSEKHNKTKDVTHMSEHRSDEITIGFYNTHADDFAKSTAFVDFHEVQDKFLSYLAKGAKILDFGCGAGRDAKYFAEKGMDVTAVDGSEELCKVAKELSGVPVRQMYFEDLSDVEVYDGIWACSSILHLKKEELKEVLPKMIRAVKPGGYIYTSFKYGDFEGYRNERYFTDFTEESFRGFLAEFTGVEPVEQWVSADVRPGRSDEKWLNLIIRKTDI